MLPITREPHGWRLPPPSHLGLFQGLWEMDVGPMPWGPQEWSLRGRRRAEPPGRAGSPLPTDAILPRAPGPQGLAGTNPRTQWGPVPSYSCSQFLPQLWLVDAARVFLEDSPSIGALCTHMGGHGACNFSVIQTWPLHPSSEVNQQIDFLSALNCSFK